MDDLISRQRAIDVIKEFQHGAAEWRDEQEEHSDIWHRADSAIASALEIGLRVKKIPSAQPEIIRCRDCKNWDKTWTNKWPPDHHYCPVIDGVRKCDFYCADAERKTDG